MCGGDAWTLAGWQPFVDLGRPFKTATQPHAKFIEDADAPLTRDPQSPTRDPTSGFQSAPLS